MIQEHQWLAQAKRLAVGMRVRTKHGHEGRANMTICNDTDRWWCYCQRCKEGGVVLKEHVLLGAPIEVHAEDQKLPNDLKPVLGSEYEQAVGKFLASKGMMFPYLPKLWYSERAKRLCLRDEAGHWHGRDLTGRSNAKWLHYNKDHLIGVLGRTTVITEDIFSMYKVAYALRPVVRGVASSYGVVSTLGAGCSTTAAIALKDCTTLIWAYDGDAAGDAGFASGSKRMRCHVQRQFRARPPDGLDPKDLSCEEIRRLVCVV